MLNFWGLVPLVGGSLASPSLFRFDSANSVASLSVARAASLELVKGLNRLKIGRFGVRTRTDNGGRENGGRSASILLGLLQALQTTKPRQELEKINA